MPGVRGTPHVPTWATSWQTFRRDDAHAMGATGVKKTSHSLIPVFHLAQRFHTLFSSVFVQGRGLPCSHLAHLHKQFAQGVQGACKVKGYLAQFPCKTRCEVLVQGGSRPQANKSFLLSHGRARRYTPSYNLTL